MRLRMKRGMTLASLVLITGILLSACGPANGSGTVTSDGAERPTISAPTNVPTETLVPTMLPTETLIPTELLPTAAQITQTEPTLPSEVITPEAPTFNLEALDSQLSEQVRSSMPEMWTYDRNTKTFVTRDVASVEFYYKDETTVLIFDEEGYQIGYIRRFNRDYLDSYSTEYYSLTDRSTRTIFPIEFYSQMGNYDQEIITHEGTFEVEQHLFAFSENYAIFPDHTEGIAEYSREVASDIIDTANGEEMIQLALLKIVARIKDVTVDQIQLDIINGIPVELDINGEKWDLGKGVIFAWRDTRTRSYDIEEGKLILYSGGPSRGGETTYGLWKYAFFSEVILDNFGLEIAEYAFVNLTPAISNSETRSPVVYTSKPDDD